MPQPQLQHQQQLQNQSWTKEPQQEGADGEYGRLKFPAQSHQNPHHTQEPETETGPLEIVGFRAPPDWTREAKKPPNTHTSAGRDQVWPGPLTQAFLETGFCLQTWEKARETFHGSSALGTAGEGDPDDNNILTRTHKILGGS